MGSMKLQEFLTPKRTLELQSKKSNSKKLITKRYVLGYYNLSCQSVINIEFATKNNPDGLSNFLNRLRNNDPEACLKALYILIEDKSDFPTYEDFRNLLDDYRIDIIEALFLLTEIVKDSIPNTRKKKILLKVFLLTQLLILTGILYMM
jgi:hypothetical protein